MNKNFTPWFSGVFLIALVGFGAAAALALGHLPLAWHKWLFLGSFFCAFVWIVGMLMAFQDFGRRALWLLLSAPFALFLPGFLVLAAAACAVSRANCL
jgi:hypothetical protein